MTVDQTTLQTLLAAIIAEAAQDDPPQSMTDIGKTLAALISPDRPAYTRQYVHMLAHGKAAITDDIGRAILTMAAMRDGVSPLQAAAQRVTTPIYATHTMPAHAVILDPAHKCRLDGCNLQIVSRRAYCTPDCQREAAKRRRAAKVQLRRL